MSATQAKVALARAKAKAAAALLADPNWKPTTHQALSFKILTQVAEGRTVREAFDTVLGPGRRGYA